MHEALIRNISLSANELRLNQENYPVSARYMLRGISAVVGTGSRLYFPEIKSLSFDPEKMLTSLLAADLSADLGLLRASYPHYSKDPVFGYRIVTRSTFATNLDNGGNIASKACRALGIPVDLLRDVSGYALTGQTFYPDGSTPGYKLDNGYINELAERAKKF